MEKDILHIFFSSFDLQLQVGSTGKVTGYLAEAHPHTLRKASEKPKNY